MSKERTSKADAEIKEREAMQDSDRLDAVKKFMKSFEDIQKPEVSFDIVLDRMILRFMSFPFRLKRGHSNSTPSFFPK